MALARVRLARVRLARVRLARVRLARVRMGWRAGAPGNGRDQEGRVVQDNGASADVVPEGRPLLPTVGVVDSPTVDAPTVDPPLRPSGGGVSVPLGTAPQRNPRATWHTRANAVVLAYLAACALAVVARDALPVPRWLAVHLFLFGAVTNAIVTWSEHFATTLLRAPAASRRQVGLRLVGLNVGILAVLAGVATDHPVLTTAGAGGGQHRVVGGHPGEYGEDADVEPHQAQADLTPRGSRRPQQRGGEVLAPGHYRVGDRAEQEQVDGKPARNWQRIAGYDRQCAGSEVGQHDRVCPGVPGGPRVALRRRTQRHGDPAAGGPERW